MTRPKPNPYELLELDPGLDLQGLTEALRERAESASAKERGQIQGIWQALTMDPKRRAEAALLARPRARRSEAVGQGDLKAVIDRLLAQIPPLPVADPIDGLALARSVDPLDLSLPPPYTSAPGPAFVWEPPKLTEDPVLWAEEGEE
ncbi:MAG: hypothetical protein AUK47_22895 [Deltaproteobacteria bacterium CG2_30_63_29]|nr:MAG: hypothetical protein AUK47_22895 [Deltaproteobacteria bacterium CG2_30_63_29]PJB37015.1 MAG: hypothetical protein CO108_22020 [Deltaproteobacteria bacterium CG_4_9_14_3_um_filter_63_12]